MRALSVFNVFDVNVEAGLCSPGSTDLQKFGPTNTSDPAAEAIFIVTIQLNKRSEKERNGHGPQEKNPEDRKVLMRLLRISQIS